MNSESSGNSGGGTPDGGGGGSSSGGRPSRYESQKRRDWNTFGQYLRNHRPPLALSRCSGAHVLEFLRYLDQFGKTKVHVIGCPFFGHPHPPAPCACPLRQAWGSLDALVGRLRAAFEENGGQPEANPFGARAVRLYLREVRDTQAKARGVTYEKKKRKRPPPPQHHCVAEGNQQPAPQAPPVSMASITVAQGGHQQLASLNLMNTTGYQYQLHGHFFLTAGDEDVMMTATDPHSGGMLPLQVLH